MERILAEKHGNWRALLNAEVRQSQGGFWHSNRRGARAKNDVCIIPNDALHNPVESIGEQVRISDSDSFSDERNTLGGVERAAPQSLHGDTDEW